MKATTDATLKREKQKYFLLKFHNFSLVRFYSILKVPRGTIRPTAPYKMTTIHDENTPIDRLGKKKEKMQHIWQYRYMRIWNGCGTTGGGRYIINLGKPYHPGDKAALQYILFSPTVLATALQNCALAYCRAKTKHEYAKANEARQGKRMTNENKQSN